MPEKKPTPRTRAARERLTLADVDGTKPGVAMLVTVDLRKGWDAQPMHTTFVEGEYNCTDPIESCERFRSSIEGDWPGHTHAVVADARARFLAANRLTRGVLGRDAWTPEEYLNDAG